MNFSLTPQLEYFVREYAATGGCYHQCNNNASEVVVREAQRLFKRTEKYVNDLNQIVEGLNKQETQSDKKVVTLKPRLIKKQSA